LDISRIVSTVTGILYKSRERYKKKQFMPENKFFLVTQIGLALEDQKKTNGELPLTQTRWTVQE